MLQWQLLFLIQLQSVSDACQLVFRSFSKKRGHGDTSINGVTPGAEEKHETWTAVGCLDCTLIAFKDTEHMSTLLVLSLRVCSLYNSNIKFTIAYQYDNNIVVHTWIVRKQQAFSTQNAWKKMFKTNWSCHCSTSASNPKTIAIIITTQSFC